MLPKKNRLKKKKEIEAVFKGNKLVSSSILIYCIKTNKQPSRFAFSVPKRIYKKAVFRNKIKRRLREIFRQEILPIIPEGFDCLIIAKEGIEKKKFKELKQEIINLFLSKYVA